MLFCLCWWSIIYILHSMETNDGHETIKMERVLEVEINQLERNRRIEEILKLAAISEDVLVGEAIALKSFKQLDLLFGSVSKKGRAIIAACVFALSSHGAFGQEDQSVDNVVPDLTYEQVVKQKQELNDLVGYDIVSEAKKVGREVASVYRESKADRTVVFLGQMHVSSRESNWEYKDNIIRSQKEIAAFLSSTTTPKTKVFLEGHSQDNGLSLSDYRKAVNYIKDIPFDGLSRVYSDYKFTVDNATLNKIVRERLLELGFVEVSPRRYVKDDVDFMLPPVNFFEQQRTNEVSSEVESGLQSSALLLHAKGVIDVMYGEKSIIPGSAGYKLRSELKSLSQATRDLSAILGNFGVDFSSGLDLGSFSMNYKTVISSDVKKPAEVALSQDKVKFYSGLASKSFCKIDVSCVRIVNEITKKIIPAVSRYIFSERENETLEMISELSGDQKVIPLVYGSAHDFTNAIKRWNKLNPGKGFNLVTIKSVLDK